MNIGSWQITRRISKPRHTGEVFVVRNAQGQVGALKRYVPKCRGERALFDRERKFNEDQLVSDVMPRWLGSGSDKDGNPFFVTELVTTLEEMRSERKCAFRYKWSLRHPLKLERVPIPFTSGRPLRRPHRELVRMMKRVAAACAKLRDGGYYHQDIKPSNMGEVDGRIVFIDYGCTLKIEEASHQEVSAGTDFYEAPECAFGITSEASLVYSLGRMTYELGDWKSRFRLSAAILAATDKIVCRRPQTCEAFSDSLDASDGTFLTLAKLVCRIWARTILCVCITVVLLGLIAAGTFLWRRGDMRDHYEREQQAYAEYVAGEGCKALGDLSNAVYFLERALEDGYRVNPGKAGPYR